MIILFPPLFLSQNVPIHMQPMHILSSSSHVPLRVSYSSKSDKFLCLKFLMSVSNPAKIRAWYHILMVKSFNGEEFLNNLVHVKGPNA